MPSEGSYHRAGAARFLSREEPTMVPLAEAGAAWRVPGAAGRRHWETLNGHRAPFSQGKQV